MPSSKTNGCLGCQAKLPNPFLDLGVTPLANSFVRPENAGKPDPVFPLAVAFCPRCFLVQLTDLVPPSSMFSEYLYFSSVSDSFLKHAEGMANDLIGRFCLDSSSRILEVGSNDGYLLQYFKKRGIAVLGVEPAANIAAAASERGIPTLNRFFGTAAVREILQTFGKLDLLIGNNVLAHVPGINDFFSAVKTCLKDSGAAVFEFPYLNDLLEKTEFDTIYHEHVFYYSLSAIAVLTERAGLALFDVIHESVHGGSLRVYIGHPDRHPVSPSVSRMLEAERAQGLTSAERYSQFSEKVRTLQNDLRSLLEKLKRDGKRLAAYGAPAKGNTLLNTCGIGRDLLEFTVDRSRHKQGLLTPGSRLPIRPPEDLVKEMPDVALVLPWNIAPEIIAQQDAYRQRGGKFVIPVPHPIEV